MGDSSGSARLFGNSPTIELTGKIVVIAIIVVFLVVVFFLFLHLYAKWFWWRTEDSTVPSREARRQRRRFVFVPGQDPALAALRKGLDPSVLRSLPVLVFNPEKFKDGLECAVCLSELAEGEKLRLLPKCNHGFHVDCIDMWFQSHSTCPLCRNPVASESSNSPSIELSIDVQSPEENLGPGYSTESPNFPTNVLFWGNETQVSTRAASLDEGSSSSSSLPLASSSQEGALVIDIPRQMIDNSSLVSPSGMRFAEEEQKSPMTTRLRSLKRLLSKEKRAVSCSPSCVDVEQAGRGQSSSAASNVQR